MYRDVHKELLCITFFHHKKADLTKKNFFSSLLLSIYFSSPSLCGIIQLFNGGTHIHTSEREKEKKFEKKV